MTGVRGGSQWSATTKSAVRARKQEKTRQRINAKRESTEKRVDPLKLTPSEKAQANAFTTMCRRANQAKRQTALLPRNLKSGDVLYGLVFDREVRYLVRQATAEGVKCQVDDFQGNPQEKMISWKVINEAWTFEQKQAEMRRLDEKAWKAKRDARNAGLKISRKVICLPAPPPVHTCELPPITEHKQENNVEQTFALALKTSTAYYDLPQPLIGLRFMALNLEARVSEKDVWYEIPEGQKGEYAECRALRTFDAGNRFSYIQAGQIRTCHIGNFHSLVERIL